MENTQKKFHISGGLWAVIAVVVFGIFLLFGIRQMKSYDRTIQVRGLCEREVPADHANYPITFKEGGDNLVQLYAEVDRKNKMIIKFLKEQGFEESDINIPAPTVRDRAASDYVSNYNTRYIITSTVNIYTEKVDKVVALQSKLSQLIEKGIAVSAGDDWENPISFEFTGLNDIKPQMIDEAIANARVAGEQFAKNSNSKLGNIKTAEQGLFSIEDRDMHNPSIKRIRVITYVTYYLK